MRIPTALTAAALLGAMGASLLATATPAAAAVSHITSARADWKAGAKGASAEYNHYWAAARHQLASYGTKDVHEIADLTALMAIPETDTTAAQRATALRATRELNGFFGTPGLYGVTAGNPLTIARADWVKSGKVAAAEQNDWLGAAVDELYAYGTKYAVARAELVSLEAIPLTDTTAKQRATASRDVTALDAFFKTPGIND